MPKNIINCAILTKKLGIRDEGKTGGHFIRIVQFWRHDFLAPACLVCVCIRGRSRTSPPQGPPPSRGPVFSRWRYKNLLNFGLWRVSTRKYNLWRGHPWTVDLIAASVSWLVTSQLTRNCLDIIGPKWQLRSDILGSIIKTKVKGENFITGKVQTWAKLRNHGADAWSTACYLIA